MSQVAVLGCQLQQNIDAGAALATAETVSKAMLESRMRHVIGLFLEEACIQLSVVILSKLRPAPIVLGPESFLGQETAQYLGVAEWSADQREVPVTSPYRYLWDCFVRRLRDNRLEVWLEHVKVGDTCRHQLCVKPLANACE